MNITQINSEVRSLTDTDSTSLTDAVLLIRTNTALEEIAGKLIVATSGGNWMWGDSNYTALPTGLFTLINSQEGYQLTGNGTTGINATTPLLDFLGCSVKDKNGNFQVLKPIRLWELLEQGIDPAEHFETDGMPQYYEKREDFLILYPAPDNGVSVTLTSGLKVFFQRTASLYTAGEVTTGTKAPGFASPFHMLMVYKMALPHLVKYKPERVNSTLLLIAKLEKEMLDFYAMRDLDTRNILTMSPPPAFS